MFQTSHKKKMGRKMNEDKKTLRELYNEEKAAKGEKQTGKLKIEEVALSGEPLVNAIVEEFTNADLHCEQTKQEVGQASGAGALVSTSGDVSGGPVNANLTRKVWNPFVAKLEQFDWWQTEIKIFQLAKYEKQIEEKNMEFRDITIEWNTHFSHGCSPIGCFALFFPVIGLIYSCGQLSPAETSEEQAAHIIMFIIFFLIPAGSIYGIFHLIDSKTRKRKKEKFRQLHEKVGEAATAAKEKLEHANG